MTTEELRDWYYNLSGLVEHHRAEQLAMKAILDELSKLCRQRAEAGDEMLEELERKLEARIEDVKAMVRRERY